MTRITDLVVTTCGFPDSELLTAPTHNPTGLLGGLRRLRTDDPGCGVRP